jgi:hypothetical protein
MSGEKGSPTESRPTITLTKRIVPFEEGNPAQEPLFINYAQVAHAAGSAYIDVGVIPLDDMLSGSDETTFQVLTRLVMSKETLSALGQQISDILSSVQDYGENSIVKE